MELSQSGTLASVWTEHPCPVYMSKNKGLQDHFFAGTFASNKPYVIFPPMGLAVWVYDPQASHSPPQIKK